MTATAVPAPDRERLRLAAVKRARKISRQAKGMAAHAGRVPSSKAYP